MLKNFHRPQWAWLMARGNALLAIGILATGAMWGVADHNWIKGYGYPFFMTTFGYSLLAMSFALLVAAALSPVTPLHRVRVPGAERIALWSYSVYLSHRAVANVLMNLLKPWSVADGVLAAIVAAASLVVGALLYELVESPFMALRDRWTLSRRSPQERPTRSSSRVATP